MLTSQKKLSLFLVLMVSFIDWMSIGLVYPMFSSMLFKRDFHLVSVETTDAMRGFYLGLLLAAASFAQFFSSPVLGTLSDAKGRKKILVQSLSIGVIGYLLAMISVFLENLPLLILSRLIIGVSIGSAAVVSAAIADLSTTEDKAKNFGLLSMACGVGFTIGPFLGGALSGTAFFMPFLFSTLVVLINLLLVVFFFKETHFLRKEHKISFSSGVLQLKKAFHMKELRIIFLCFFLFMFGWSFYYEFIPTTWISKYRLSAKDIGTLFAYSSGFYALSTGLLIRPVVGRYKPLPIVFHAFWISGSYILAMVLITSVFSLWFYLPLQQFLIALAFPTVLALISNKTSADMQGEVLGIFQSVQSFAFVVSPLLAGPLLGLTINMPIIIGGLSMLLAAFIIGSIFKKEIFCKEVSL